jgi:hypothetical protein
MAGRSLEPRRLAWMERRERDRDRAGRKRQTEKEREGLLPRAACAE